MKTTLGANNPDGNGSEVIGEEASRSCIVLAASELVVVVVVVVGRELGPASLVRPWLQPAAAVREPCGVAVATQRARGFVSLSVVTP
jgi:hypothetical protein